MAVGYLPLAVLLADTCDTQGVWLDRNADD